MVEVGEQMQAFDELCAAAALPVFFTSLDNKAFVLKLPRYVQSKALAQFLERVGHPGMAAFLTQ